MTWVTIFFLGMVAGLVVTLDWPSVVMWLRGRL